jgi:quercetin dioxygenase-like cupin family protein
MWMTVRRSPALGGKTRSFTMTRTMLTLAVVAAIGMGGITLAETEHSHGMGPMVKTLSAVDVGEELNGKPTRATTQEVTFEPGAASAPHRHPGPVFGYVLEGELEFQAGDAPPRRLKAGDTFYEPAMVLHAVARNPSTKVRARVLAVILHPRDAKALVVPEPAKGGK